MLLAMTIFIILLTIIYGWSYRRSYQQPTLTNTCNFSNNQLSNRHELFLKTVFTLLGYVAKCDGAVNIHEIERIEVFMKKMGLDSNHKREAIRLFKIGAEPKFNAKNTIHNFKSLAKKSQNLTQTLLAYLINLARVDGLLVNKEVDTVRNIALELGCSATTFNALLTLNHDPKNTVNHQQQCHNIHRTRTLIQTVENRKLIAAYALFDMQQTATNSEIKKAYRLLATQFHPDKLIGQALQLNKVKTSTENFKIIQTAYENIRKSRALTLPAEN